MKQLDEIFWAPRGHTFKTANQSLTVEEMMTILRGWEQEDDCLINQIGSF